MAWCDALGARGRDAQDAFWLDVSILGNGFSVAGYRVRRA